MVQRITENSIEQQSDDALYQQFKSGDVASYDQLLIRYGDSLIMYLYGYIHDWHEAEDQMIEAFARIMVKKPNISSGNFKAYLFRVGRNLVLRLHERRRRIQIFSVDGMERDVADSYFASAASTVKANSEHIPLELVKEERRQILQSCLERIDPQQREALWLVYMENMSYQQAASVMGIKVKRIDYLLSLGKQHMRKELEKEGVTNAYE